VRGERRSPFGVIRLPHEVDTAHLQAATSVGPRHDAVPFDEDAARARVFLVVSSWTLEAKPSGKARDEAAKILAVILGGVRDTTGIGTPSAINKDAAVCRRSCIRVSSGKPHIRSSGFQ
jgi:hypothetical protein